MLILREFCLSSVRPKLFSSPRLHELALLIKQFFVSKELSPFQHRSKKVTLRISDLFVWLHCDRNEFADP